jgi:bacterioferritin-associated ferredoxin
MSKKALIAPCGMNCGICLGYLREKIAAKVAGSIAKENRSTAKNAS